MLQRPRRNRASTAVRTSLRETHLAQQDPLLPLFVQAGQNPESPTIPDPARLSIALEPAPAAKSLRHPA